MEPKLIKNIEKENSTTIDLLSKTEISTTLYNMIDYSLSKGLEIPNTIYDQIEQGEYADLFMIYNELKNKISPATPQSILYFKKQLNFTDNKTGKNRTMIPHIIKQMSWIAIGTLLILIGTSLSPYVNYNTLEAGLLNSSGIPLLFNLLFICSSAVLGVLFYLLKDLSSKIKTHSLIEEDTIDIFPQILVGAISGFLISEMFGITTTENIMGGLEVHKMMLAILGGFSSDAIFSVMQSLVNKFKSFFSTT